ncbi:ABC transporter permease [Alteribacter aurantiacus]|uniref:ABC transporter permease n=1 Tax=Alteribacter aurantiacus TaxID=254410 RepID=UPI000406DF17|nr:ABC transporter permease [Alteribacter aurantiacus]
MRNEQIQTILQLTIAITIGAVVGAIAMIVSGAPVITTYIQMWNGAFGNFYLFSSTLANATPILLIALGVGIAFRAGVFNLGGEGQMVLAAVTASLVAIYLPGPGFVKVLAAITTGFLVGGGLSMLAGWMESRFQIQLIISTLLLNYIVVLFASYLVSFPFQDRTGSAALSQTAMLDPAARLPKLFTGMTVHWGFVIALLLAVVLYVMLKHTSFGYDIMMSGKNASFAFYGGVSKTKMMLHSMLISGGLAGLAGVFEVLGSQYRFVDGSLTDPGYAWSGIMAALLAKSHPLAIVFASLFLGALHTGSLGLERNTDVPLEIANVIKATLILFITAKFSITWWQRRKKAGVSTSGTV